MNSDEFAIEDVGSDIYVRIRSDLIVIGDSIITDRHHASNGNYEDDDPQNQIGGIIPAFSLSGWLRHGMEKIIQQYGGTACHPGESKANFKKDSVYSRDLESGYHAKGSCLNEGNGCVILDLYGGFENRPGKIMRRPIQFSPVRSNVDYTRGQAEGHYRRINRNIVSRNEKDGRDPLRNNKIDAVGNLDGCWHLSFRQIKPEFIALLSDSVEFLDNHSTDFMHQLGGARNFGGGVVDCEVINPLYDEREFSRVFDRRKSKTGKMEKKDDRWANEYLPVFQEALMRRVKKDDG